MKSVATDSKPPMVRTTLFPFQMDEYSKSRSKTPVGFFSGTKGGSWSKGICTFV